VEYSFKKNNPLESIWNFIWIGLVYIEEMKVVKIVIEKNGISHQ